MLLETQPSQASWYLQRLLSNVFTFFFHSRVPSAFSVLRWSQLVLYKPLSYYILESNITFNLFYSFIFLFYYVFIFLNATLGFFLNIYTYTYYQISSFIYLREIISFSLCQHFLIQFWFYLTGMYNSPGNYVFTVVFSDLGSYILVANPAHSSTVLSCWWTSHAHFFDLLQWLVSHYI